MVILSVCQGSYDLALSVGVQTPKVRTEQKMVPAEQELFSVNKLFMPAKLLLALFFQPQ